MPSHHSLKWAKSRLNDLLDINSGVRKYIIINTWTGLLAAGANTVVLMVLGVDFALLWGLLSFLLNYIPSVGFICPHSPISTGIGAVWVHRSTHCTGCLHHYQHDHG